LQPFAGEALVELALVSLAAAFDQQPEAIDTVVVGVGPVRLGLLRFVGFHGFVEWECWHEKQIRKNLWDKVLAL
jgi:hypothetical protein